MSTRNLKITFTVSEALAGTVLADLAGKVSALDFGVVIDVPHTINKPREIAVAPPAAEPKAKHAGKIINGGNRHGSYKVPRYHRHPTTQEQFVLELLRETPYGLSFNALSKLSVKAKRNNNPGTALGLLLKKGQIVKLGPGFYQAVSNVPAQVENGATV